MRYIIVGASRETGEDVEIEVVAASEADAHAAAGRKGVLVAMCSPAKNDHAKLDSSSVLSNTTTAPEAEAEHPARLRPGEQDCFYEGAMLGLLRRQVEPEELLMACDVRQPHSRHQRTMLLTPTRLMFVGVSDQQGQRMIVDRQERDLRQIDQISATSQPPSMFARNGSYLIQIASRDGIESWTTSYSSGGRIVEAVQALKQGKAVPPFIRRIEDMAAAIAAAAAALPPAAVSMRPAWVPAWTDRLVLPPLRISRNRAALATVTVVASLGIAVATILVVLGGTILLAALLSGRNGDMASSAVVLFAGVVMLATSIPNAYFAQGRMSLVRHGQPDSIAATPMTTQVTPIMATRMWSTLPWGRIASILLPIVVLGGLGLWSYSYYQSEMHPPLPTIKLTGIGAQAVTINDWRMDASRWLFGTVRFTGEAGVELRYRVLENGVVRDTGVIDPPSGLGTLIISREPQEVRIMLPSRPTPNTHVEIMAIGG
jgi:hypothetical protein